MATANVTTRPSLVLEDIDWRMYSRLLRVFAERPAIRLTYDRGRLEIMSPLLQHEVYADLLGRFVVVLTEELGLPIQAGRSTTLRRRRKRRGVEPDHSWWIAHAKEMQGRLELDLKRDPPPDLAVEIDVTHGSLDRMSIYAALGVPEVWRLAEDGLAFHLLQPSGSYVAGPSSTFPGLAAADLGPFLALRAKTDENDMVRQFRAWVRQRIADGWK
jgi:Uma2 family endonuclease